MVYQFKTGSHLRGSAQEVGERLNTLEAKGRLTPEEVVRDARNIRSVLHAYFEWDDAKAAEQHRLAQASHLIRSVTVVMEQTEEESRTVRAFVPVGVDATRQYVQMARALSDADMRRQVLSQAHSELGAVARKYRELQELSDVLGAIERVGELLKEGQSA